MIVALSHNAPELIEPLRKQISQVQIIDVANNPPIEGAFMRIDNEYWVKNWHKVLTEIRQKRPYLTYILMLNDDINGLSIDMYHNLIREALKLDSFMITPAFNSPHEVFHPKGQGVRQVNWIDMCCPLINIDKYFELGGFDMDFIGYFADIDISYRARQKGFKMYVCDDLVIDHIGGYTTNKVGSKQSDMSYNEVLVRKYGKSWNELI